MWEPRLLRYDQKEVLTMKKDNDARDIMKIIPNDILTQSKFTTDEIKGYFAELESIFKDLNYPEIFLPIDSTAALNSLIKFSKNLKGLKNCQGFTTCIPYLFISP